MSHTMEFEKLMELAAQQTLASQAALAKETQLRLAREKARRMEEERKEQERLRAEKDRAAKRKRDDEIKEQQLQAERRRRLAERAAVAAAAAEQPSASISQPGRPRNSTAAACRPRKSPGTVSALKNQDMDPSERRYLEREEKAARAKARIFGEPYKPSASKPRKATNSSKGKAKMAAPKPSTFGPGTTAGTGMLSARQRIEQEFKVDVRRPLNQVKRDRRTIEEVERDMRLRRGICESNRPSGSTFFHEDPRLAAIRREKEASQHLKVVQHPESSSSLAPPTSINAAKRKAVPLSAPLNPPSVHPSPNKRPRPDPLSGPTPGSSHTRPQPSASGVPKSTRLEQASEDEDSDSYSEPDEEEETLMPATAVRDEIWKIMGKDRNTYIRREVYTSEEESEDMEVAADDLLAEERRAAALARKEDLREQEALKKSEAEKKRRLSSARSPK